VRAFFNHLGSGDPDAVVGMATSLVANHIALDGACPEFGRLLSAFHGDVHVRHTSKSPQMAQIDGFLPAGQMPY
jgi:hypothetical protein